MLQTHKTKSKEHLFFAIKSIVFTIILFSIISLLTINNNKDSISSSLEIQQHQSASSTTESYQYKFQTMCVNNLLSCIRIDFDGAYTYKEKYFYLASIIYISNFLNENISEDTNFSKSIKKISLKSQGGKRRGYASKTYIEINTDLINSYGEFIEIFTHEAGHIVDLAILEGNHQEKDKEYTEFGKAKFSINDPSIDYYKISFENETTRRVDSNKEEFCSRYGMTDPFEDFAECLNLYINHHNLFEYIAKYNVQLQKKYTIIDTLLDHKYLNNDTTNNSKNIKKATRDKSRRTRDTTKL